MSRAFLMPALLLFACADVTSPGARFVEDDAVESARLPVVYGADDRREVFEHDGQSVRSLARSSLVALIPRERLAPSDVEGSFSLLSEPLGDALGLCDSERFIEQPTAAECSGVLIAPDLVLTAAHCFDSTNDCARYAYVFDYLYTAAGALESIDAADVVSCEEIAIRRLSDSNQPLREDFAVVRLSQPVDALRTPIALRRGPVRLSERLTVLGFPSGLPAKIDAGAIVRSPRVSAGDYFTLDSDTFRGSSGSPVLDASQRLAGIIVRGGIDYVDAPDAGCAIARTIGEDLRGDWEQATYSTRVLEVLCEDPERAPSLCKADPVCGDGVCERVEARSCPADCLDMCALSLCKPNQESEQRLGVVLQQTSEEASETAQALEGRASGQGCSTARQRAGRESGWLIAMFAALCWRRCRGRATCL